MQSQQTPSSRLRPQRPSLREISPGALTTAISIFAVVVIVAVTFFADWLQVPTLSASAPTQYLSPNADGNYDTFTVNYRIDTRANITARVLNPQQQVVRTITTGRQQNPGDYFLTWDGRNDQGLPVADGSYNIEVIAAGSMRSTSQPVPVLVDTQPPTVSLANLTDTARVNKPDFLLDGVTEPGAVVWLSGVSQPLRVDTSGRFSQNLKLADGDNRFEIQAIDQAGNTTRLNRSISLITEAPDLTITRPTDNEWVNGQMLTIEGTTLPGAVLTINQQKVTAGVDGRFKHQVVLNEGDNSIRVTVTDDLGNITTLDRVVHLKSGSSPIQVNLPEGASLGDPNLVLTGKVEPGSTLLVNGRAVPVGSLGDFQVNLTLLQGENAIRIESRDLAGNTSSIVRRVVYAPGSQDGLVQVQRGLEYLPLMIVPIVLVVAVILAFIYLRQNKVSLTLSVDQPVFVPGNPGEQNSVSILLDLSKTARVSLEVLDQQGYPRAVILQNRRKIGRRHVFYWNGYDDRGRPLPPGDYTVQAEAGAPPLQVTSAVHLRIDRPGMPQVQTPAYVRGGSVETRQGR